MLDFDSNSSFYFQQTTSSSDFQDNTVKSTKDIVFIVDAENRISAVNQAITDLLGYSEKELIGRPVEMLFSENELLHISINKIREEGYFTVNRIALKTGSGTCVPVTFSGSLIREKNTNSENLVIVARDITRRKQVEEALLSSYEITKIVFENMNDALSVIDTHNFKILGTNNVFLKEIGLREEEVIGKTCYEITHNRTGPCTPPNDTCPLLDTITTGKQAVAEHIHYDSNGKKRYVEVSTSPIMDENRNIVKVIHISKDITTRRKAENDLFESQEMLLKDHEDLKNLFTQVKISKMQWQKTMDAVGDIIILTDKEDKVLKYNRAFSDFFNKSNEELLGKDWETLLTENEIEFDTCYGKNIELFQKSTCRWFTLNSYPFDDNEPGLSNTVITLHETTAMKRMTEKLIKNNKDIKESREKFQNALNGISSLIQQVVREMAFDIRFSNPNLKTCYETKKCDKKDCPCYGKGATRCWQIAGTYCGGEVQGALAKKFGNCSECSIFKEVTSDPIYHIGEHFNNMMHILETKNRELDDAYKKLKTTQTHILQQEKMASIGQLAAGVAHEINNPMGYISSNLGTLGKYTGKLVEFIRELTEVADRLNGEEQTGRLKEKRKQLKIDYILEDIEPLIMESLEGTDRVKKIVRNLKTFSRIDEAVYKHADINECVESTLNIVWNELKYKATVKKELGEIPLTRCYPHQLNQVIMNLLVNAAQAIEKQGEITIKTWNGDGTINISISDTGCGIPTDKINKIYEPFYTSKEIGKGTGLGLSIVYDIVKKHNGEITVDSVMGIGTSFTIKIPVVEGR